MYYLVNVSNVSNYLNNNIDENNKYFLIYLIILNFVYYIMYY